MEEREVLMAAGATKKKATKKKATKKKATKKKATKKKVSQEEGHQEEGRQEEGQEEGSQEEGHQEEGDQEEGHQEEGRQEEGQEEGHQEEGQEEGHQEEGHQEEGHQEEGHQEEGHEEEGDQEEGHEEEGHQEEGHQEEGHQEEEVGSQPFAGELERKTAGVSPGGFFCSSFRPAVCRALVVSRSVVLRGQVGGADLVGDHVDQPGEAETQGRVVDHVRITEFLDIVGEGGHVNLAADQEVVEELVIEAEIALEIESGDVGQLAVTVDEAAEPETEAGDDAEEGGRVRRRT